MFRRKEWMFRRKEWMLQKLRRIGPLFSILKPVAERQRQVLKIENRNQRQSSMRNSESIRARQFTLNHLCIMRLFRNQQNKDGQVF
jgi:hypothetical protein